MELLEELALGMGAVLRNNGVYLLGGLLLGSGMTVYVDPERMRRALLERGGWAVPGAVAFGAFTPLCACGTLAVLVALVARALPWGPVMAFLVSSPLTSPSELVFEMGFLGRNLAVGVAVASVVLGLGAGICAHLLEGRTGFFEGQFRLSSKSQGTGRGCGCGGAPAERPSWWRRWKLDRWAAEFWRTGVCRVLPLFVLFVALGTMAQRWISPDWILRFFGTGRSWGIPLAATLGLPLYLTDASALPLLSVFREGGAGEGAVLAFLVTGKATGLPVLAGLSAFLRSRALGFYVAWVYLGGMAAGWGFDVWAGR